jgi:hypothetical protein
MPGLPLAGELIGLRDGYPMTKSLYQKLSDLKQMNALLG